MLVSRLKTSSPCWGKPVDSNEPWQLFESRAAAGRWVGCSSTNVGLCIRGKTRSAGGWVFVDYHERDHDQ